MGSSSGLVDWLEFSHGLDFKADIDRWYGSTIHHPFSNPSRSFFLLVTFRRFLFCLTKESIALALQSCLGGRASGYHVKFLSEHHFCFSVALKQVGFSVYQPRRVVTNCFDAYFHLRNNGTSHWEREKCAWEIEQAKEGTKVLSKMQRKILRKRPLMINMFILPRSSFKITHRPRIDWC